jgi:DNA-binding protein HU-beta
LNKGDLINAVVEKTGLTKKDTEKAVNAVFEIIKDSLGQGESVKLVGFGTFETRERAARLGRNPQTGEEIQIPSAVVPAFKAGKALKESVAL